jgi:hypothetical protein
VAVLGVEGETQQTGDAALGDAIVAHKMSVRPSAVIVLLSLR